MAQFKWDQIIICLSPFTMVHIFFPLCLFISILKTAAFIQACSIQLPSIISFLPPLAAAHLSPFASCQVGQAVGVAAASVSGRFGPPASLVSQPPVGPCGQELLTEDLPHLDTPATGLGALEGPSRR